MLGALAGHLAFLQPALLGFLGLLPVIWWLLRLTPPSPKKTVFPALSLLRHLVKAEETPARTPWWLLLLRLGIAALIILAFAEPVINPEAVTSGKGALLIAIDNDWAAARDWDARQQQLLEILREASRDNREVYLLPTTPPSSGEALQSIGPIAAKAAIGDINRIKPQPWPADWQQAAKLVKNIPAGGFSSSVWLSGGLGNADAALFYNALVEKGEVHSFGDAATPIYVLTPPQSDADQTTLSVMRAVTDNAASVSVAALDRSGHALSHIAMKFAQGDPRATASLDLPLDIRNQVVRFEVELQRTAAATVLLDASWEHRPVGIVGDKAELDRKSLLSGLFYIDRALEPYADIHIGGLDDLLKQSMAVLVLPGDANIPDDQVDTLTSWIKKGGVLVRFANDSLSENINPKESDLLPVVLRSGDRSMGGTLSWSTPQTLQNFPEKSPFHGLSVPADVTVSRQILAEPSNDLAPHTWAALADGTPLVTAKNIGQGLTILFHVPARSDWSNLPLSGLFVDMLRRVVDLSHGAGSNMNFTSLPPLHTLNAFGEEQKPDAAAQPVTDPDFSKLQPGPQHPPGLYGTATLNRAFNLGTAIGQPEALRNVQTEPYRQKTEQSDLESDLLVLAFVMLLFDFGMSLHLRGLLLRRTATAAFLFACLLGPQAHAAQLQQNAVELTSRTTLAYVETGDRDTDRISELGLAALARTLQNRTSIDDIAVTGVNPDTDDLAFFSILYWPLVSGEAPLSPEGAKRVNDYLHHGGMILFDSMTGEMLSPNVTQHFLAGIDLPPLQHLPQNHVLKRSFYLLDSFPGRYANDDFWLEPEEASSYDGVATVLSGTNGWAAAWATDDSGRFLFPCSPGGDMQRERAYRFGVNIVMYALTGNYKSDQLHVQALLERMGK